MDQDRRERCSQNSNASSNYVVTAVFINNLPDQPSTPSMAQKAGYVRASAKPPTQNSLCCIDIF
jgi:hypothetical protein